MGIVKYKNVDPANIGFTMGKLSPEAMEEIKKEIDKIQSDFDKAQPHNQYLVGNIEQEYTIVDSREIIYKCALELLYRHGQDYDSKYLMEDVEFPPKFVLSPCWVNFMKKGEFNPVHKHTGTFSFVIWYDIPYSMEDEAKYSPGRKSALNKAGCFEFLYTNSLGAIGTEVIEADKKFNGTMLIFPAMLNHVVYPFYSSDKYRISISGNLKAV